MQRSRQIGAAPRRLAPDAWDVIAALIVDTLERSPEINAADVAAVLTIVAPVGIMLIAGGHLDRQPLVVVADPVHLSITTVSGSGASTLEENLSPVPGGASATGWTLHLPVPDHLREAAKPIVDADIHLSVDPAPTETRSAVTSAGPSVDLDALARRFQRSR
jgi:hypothetical protein